MTRRHHQYLGAALAAVVPVLLSCTSSESDTEQAAAEVESASMETMSAMLSGADLVPPVTTEASGMAEMTIDGNEVHVTLELSNIDNVTAIHIHDGAIGENGPVLAPLYGGETTSAGYTGTLVDTTITVTEEVLAAIRAGTAYVNVHTEANPGGEVRGQIGN